VLGGMEQTMKLIDTLLDMILVAGITLQDLQDRQLQRDQPEADTNKINNNNNSLEASPFWVELSDQLPEPAKQLAQEIQQTRPELSQVSPLRLWTDFVAFNRLKGRKGLIRLKAFFGFLRVWEDRLEPTKAYKPVSPAPSLTEHQRGFQELCAAARADKVHEYKQALERLWGINDYASAVKAMAQKWDVSLYRAAFAVHGDSVKQGILKA